jgi:hypothetical protein
MRLLSWVRLLPARDLLALARRVVQPELGAAPQHVVAAGGPLFVLQVAQLALVQSGRHLGAQVLLRARVAQYLCHARAIGPCQAPGQRRRKPGVLGLHRRHEALEVVVGVRRHADPARQVAAREKGAFGPGRARFAQHASHLVGRVFGQLAKCRDLAAPHRQQRRRGGVALEHVVARHGRRVARFVVEQWTHAGVRPGHVGRHHGFLEIAAGLGAEVGDLVIADVRGAGVVALEFDVGGADQGEVVLIGNREDDPLVRVLEDVGVVVREQARHHDVAALDQPQALGSQRLALGRTGNAAQEGFGPRAGRIHHGACAHGAPPALPRFEHRAPAGGSALRLDAAGARQHLGPARARIERIEHHQPRIIDPAIGIDEAPLELGLERLARRVPAQIDRARRGQHLAVREVVVHEQADADHPGRPHRRIVRHHEAQRPHDVGRAAQQHLALLQRLAHQRELVVLEIAQPAMYQLGRGRRGVRGQVVLLAQEHAPAAARQIARNATAVDTPADDQHVAIGGRCSGRGGRRGVQGSSQCRGGRSQAPTRVFRIFSFWFLIARFFSAFSPRLFAFVRSTVAGLALRCRQ